MSKENEIEALRARCAELERERDAAREALEALCAAGDAAMAPLLALVRRFRRDGQKVTECHTCGRLAEGWGENFPHAENCPLPLLRAALERAKAVTR